MKRVAFLGAGKMAGAIASGLLNKGIYTPDELAGCDISTMALESFAQLGIAGFLDKTPLDSVETVIIAVKPQQLAAALAGTELAGKNIISIAAGITIDKLIKLTGSSAVARVMPNTPAMYGCGAAAYALSEDAPEELAQTTVKIFESIGSCYLVEEKLLDAVTGLSGSGPAYVFSFIQALADGGVSAGLPRKLASELAIDTVLGAALMVKKSGEHPAVLRDMVTSPGGTTARGLEELELGAFTGTVIKAVRAAAARSEELNR